MRVAQLRVLGGAVARVPGRRHGVRPPQRAGSWSTSPRSTRAPRTRPYAQAWVDDFAAALQQGDDGRLRQLPRRRGRGAGPRGLPGRDLGPARGDQGAATTRPTSSGSTRTSRRGPRDGGQEPTAEHDERCSEPGVTPTPWAEARADLERAKVYGSRRCAPTDGRMSRRSPVSGWRARCTSRPGRRNEKARNLEDKQGRDHDGAMARGLRRGGGRRCGPCDRRGSATAPGRWLHREVRELFVFRVRDNAMWGEGSDDPAPAYELRATKGFGFGKGTLQPDPLALLDRGREGVPPTVNSPLTQEWSAARAAAERSHRG